MSAPDPNPSSEVRAGDLCVLAAALAMFAQGGLANGGPGGYAQLSLSAAPRPGFQPLADGAADLLGPWASLLLFAAGAAGFTLLLAHRFGSRWLAGAAGALYAVHPLWGEAFVWTESRGVLLALPLLFAAHLALHRSLSRHRLPWLGALLFACAVLSWNGAVAYGLVLALDSLRGHPVRAASVVGGCLVVALLLGAFGSGRDGDPAAGAQLAAATATVFDTAVELVVPLTTTVDAGPDAHGSWGGSALAGVALLLLLVGLLVLRTPPPVRAVAALAIAGTLAAVHVLPATEPVFTHFRAGLCIAAFALAVALLARKASFWRTSIVGLIVAVLAVLSGLRGPDLASEAALWTAAFEADGMRPRARLALARLALEESPAAPAVRPKAKLPVAYANTGYAIRAKLLECDALFRDGDHETLLDEASDALMLLRTRKDSYRLPRGLNAARSQAHRYHGDALLHVVGRAAAIDSYRRAVTFDDTNVEAVVRLGRALAASGNEQKLVEAAELLDDAVLADPSRLDAVRALARTHILLRNPTAAFAVLDRARRHHGDAPDLLFARARAHLSGTRNVAKAQELLRRIQEIDPERTHEEAAKLQAEIHVAVGRRFYERARAGAKDAHFKDALERFDAALRAAPEHWQAHVFAGDALAAMDRFDEAKDRYRKARDAAPDQRWVARLLARSAVLQAGAVAGGPEGDARRKAARLVSEAVRDTNRLDLGYTSLESELALLRQVADSLSDDALATRAAAILLTARAVLTGADSDAYDELAAAFAARTDDEKHPHLLDASLLLRAMLYEQGGNLIEARRDYLLLAERRSDDALPTLRKLQIEMRIALAQRKTALAFSEEKQRLERAQARVARIAERILAYVLAHPRRLDAQMLAVEADMHQGNWIESLSRLNRLRDEYPEDSSVLRGLATVYMEHHAASGDPDLLTAAGRHVREALMMDPRDMRALLDQAQIGAKAQDFDKAIRFAEEAQRFDPLTRGPSTRLLADLHLARAQRALEGGQAEAAAKSVKAARRADPAGPGSYLWEGKVLLAQASGGAKARKLQQALQVGLKAKELAPFGRDVDTFLADIHRQLGFAALLEMRRVHRNPDPRKDAKFETLSAAEQGARMKRYHALAKRNAQHRKAYQGLAQDHYDQALALEPVGPDAEETRRRLATLRASGDDARRQRGFDSKDAYARGQQLHHAGKSLEAMRAYAEAIQLDRTNVRAHFWLLRAAYQNLIGVRMDDPDEKRFADRTLSAALRSLHALDALDTQSLFPERWYWRGQLNRWMYRSLDSAPSRHAARAAYRRFLTLKSQAGITESAHIERARVHLDALTRRGE